MLQSCKWEFIIKTSVKRKSRIKIFNLVRQRKKTQINRHDFWLLRFQIKNCSARASFELSYLISSDVLVLSLMSAAKTSTAS